MPETGRRGFLYTVMGTVGTLIGLGYLLISERFMLPTRESQASMQSIGKVSDFPLNQAQLRIYTGDAGFPDGVYIVKQSQGLLALDEHCAHLQCPVQWVGSQQEFACPCHGSVYNSYGQVTGGPAPHPLNFHKLVIDGENVLIGGLIHWGTPEWNAIATKMGMLGKWTPGSVPGTVRWSSEG